MDQVGFYIEDLMLETRTGGEDEDLQALEDDEISGSLIQAFQYKVKKNNDEIVLMLFLVL